MDGSAIAAARWQRSCALGDVPALTAWEHVLRCKEGLLYLVAEKFTTIDLHPQRLQQSAELGANTVRL
jgi:hypothetical protein